MEELELWPGIVGHLTELFQPSCTRSAKSTTPAATASRIDRIYSSLRPSMLNDLIVTVQVVGSLHLLDRLSDHALVEASLSSFSVATSSPECIHPRIPRWVSSHPFYPVAVQMSMAAHREDISLLGPWEALSAVKQCLRMAVKEVRRVAELTGAKTAGERIHWSILALRAIRDGSVIKLRRACRAFPGICVDGHLFGLEFHVNLIENQLLVDVGLDTKSQLEELDSIKDLPEYARQSRTSSIMKWASKWAPKHRRVGINGAIDDLGNVVHNPIDAIDVFVGHWKKGFCAQRH